MKIIGVIRAALAINHPASIAIILFAFLMVSLSIVGGIRGYSPIPYWDMWDSTLNFVIKVSDGDWRAWWAQHNEHRIVLSRLLFWADNNWFGGLSILLIMTNYFIVGVSAFVLFRILHAYTYKVINKDIQLVIGFFIVSWLFQWMQSQNFIWGFQSQFLLVQLLPLCSLYYLSKSISFDLTSRASFLIACLFGVLSVGTMANGLIVLPLMLVYVILYKQSKCRIVTLGVLTLASSYFYLIDYVSPGGHGSLIKTITHDPVGLARYSLTYLGSPFHYLVNGFTKGLFAQFAGLVFIVLFLGVIKKSLNSIRQTPLKFALIFYIAFIVVTSIVTGGGRLIFGVQQALDSRYTTPAIMAWATLLILYSPFIPALIQRSGKLGKILIIFFCLAIFAQQVKALRSESQLNFLKRVAGLALALNIPDSDRIGAVYPSAQGALTIAESAKGRNLSFFAIEPYRSINEPIIKDLSVDNLGECIGYIDAVEFVKDYPKFGRVSGWIFNSKSKSAPEYVEFLNQNNEVVGYSVVGSRRSDLKESISASAVKAGFEGYIDLNQGGRLITMRGKNGGCLTQPLILPIKPFIAIEDNPGWEKTKITVNQIQSGNQWIGADFERSEFKGMSVYGTYIKGDLDKGSIELRVRPGDRLFYRSGPISGAQMLEIPVQNVSVVLPRAEKWIALEFNSLLNPSGHDALIKITDKGSNWGEWSAIAVKN